MGKPPHNYLLRYIVTDISPCMGMSLIPLTDFARCTAQAWFIRDTPFAVRFVIRLPLTRAALTSKQVSAGEEVLWRFSGHYSILSPGRSNQGIRFGLLWLRSPVPLFPLINLPEFSFGRGTFITRSTYPIYVRLHFLSMIGGNPPVWSWDLCEWTW